MQCRICDSTAVGYLFSGTIFDERVSYFECPDCGYVQTETPYWLERAYSSAINDCDTGILARNSNNLDLVLTVLALLNIRHGRVCDFAGGYGVLVRMLRDSGVDAYWDDRYCDNLFAKGFQYSGEQEISLATAFEALEHFVDPAQELERLFEKAPNLLVSTELIAKPAPPLEDWWYYGPDHGQHIGFFRVETLQHLAERFGKYLLTDGQSYHLFSSQPASALQWRLYRRLIGRWRGPFLRDLESRTWSDFLYMSGK